MPLFRLHRDYRPGHTNLTLCASKEAFDQAWRSTDPGHRASRYACVRRGVWTQPRWRSSTPGHVRAIRGRAGEWRERQLALAPALRREVPGLEPSGFWPEVVLLSPLTLDEQEPVGKEPHRQQSTSKFLPVIAGRQGFSMNEAMACE
jgi:hypothetical protein